MDRDEVIDLTQEVSVACEKVEDLSALLVAARVLDNAADVDTGETPAVNFVRGNVVV